MPNLTPPRYRSLYEIYPAKACLRETASWELCEARLRVRIAGMGRGFGTGPGGPVR